MLRGWIDDKYRKNFDSSRVEGLLPPYLMRTRPLFGHMMNTRRPMLEALAYYDTGRLLKSQEKRRKDYLSSPLIQIVAQYV